MGFAVWASSGIMERTFGDSRWGRIADLSVSIPLGLAVFYAFSRALRIADLEPAFRAIAGPVMRRVRR